MDLQETSTDPWCSKVARGIINIGNPIFHALEKGLKSKIRRCPNSIRYFACEILLNETEQFLHPGSELEGRLRAFLCIYNYASGKGNAFHVNISKK
ncbi:hypothetical protein CMV_028953 [Castanea mollissima]|uniref:Uncharacterized protein n=1 Tax=Castanea mollissima TaxID=60419 RepID=A0A8J4VDV9_9ROSI|nr:hypothetical protein CMV_028953 [Castanea mollissima]